MTGCTLGYCTWKSWMSARMTLFPSSESGGGGNRRPPLTHHLSTPSPGCSVDREKHGSHACACVDRYVYSSSEGYCFDGDAQYGACATCGFNPSASKVSGSSNCVACEDGYEVDVVKDDCTGHCVLAGTAFNPVETSGCESKTEGNYKCEVFEHVAGSCDDFLTDLVDNLTVSVWLCCAGAVVSG